MSCAPPRHVAAAALAAALLPVSLFAQTPAPLDVGASASIAAVLQLDTDLDRAGEFRWSAGIASGSVTRRVTPEVSIGLALRYDFEDWRFSDPAAFGGSAPWGHLNAPNLAFDFRHTIGSDVVLGVSPLFGWAFESRAKASDALTYGAIVTATRTFSPRLLLGAGAGIVRQVDDTKVFPFLIVRWQIDERWRLENPFSAGPAGGAGLELTYRPDERWELALGAAKRSTRYRLDGTGIAPGGVGENRFFPAFARVARNFGARSKVDLYAGVALRGRLSVADANGSTVASDDYSTAPLIGATFAHRF